MSFVGQSSGMKEVVRSGSWWKRESCPIFASGTWWGRVGYECRSKRIYCSCYGRRTVVLSYFYYGFLLPGFPCPACLLDSCSCISCFCCSIQDLFCTPCLSCIVQGISFLPPLLSACLFSSRVASQRLKHAFSPCSVFRTRKLHVRFLFYFHYIYDACLCYLFTSLFSAYLFSDE